MRPDGRATDELRPLSVVMGELSRADGSGRFAFGPTAALASVTGPIEVRLNKELTTRATLEVVHRPLEGVSATPSRALMTTLEGVFVPLLNLSAYPRSLVQLVVQSLSPSPTVYPAPTTSTSTASWPPSAFPSVPASAPMTGSTFAGRAAALNAATLATLQAGSVGMRALPLAVALAKTRDSTVVDPASDEEAQATARFGFAWAFGAGIASSPGIEEGDEAELVWAEAEGEFTKQEFNDARDASLVAAREVLAFVRVELDKVF